jgi:hypothetical protein
MSQIGEFDIHRPPSAVSAPSFQASDVTAGGPVPAYYQMRLNYAGMIHTPKCEPEHAYLYDVFKDELSSPLSFDDERYRS